MAARAEELKADLLERVLKRVQERMDPDRRAAVEAFVQQFYAHVPPVDLVDVRTAGTNEEHDFPGPGGAAWPGPSSGW